MLPTPTPGRILLLVSPDSTLEPLFEMVAYLALQGPLYVLDSGNIFQGYYLARALRRRTLDFAEVMQRVLLTRAFTCYQVATLLEESDLTRESQAAPRPVLVLDFLATFYDQGVRIADRRRLLRGCIRRLQQLSQRVPVVVWVRQRPVIPEEALSFLETVEAAAGQVWSPPRRPVLASPRQTTLF